MIKILIPIALAACLGNAYAENPITIDEIEKLLVNVQKSAQLHKNSPFLAQVYLIRAQLELLKLDIIKANQLFTKGQQLAEENNLGRYSRKISYFHDNFLEKMDLWEDLAERNASLSERLELAQLEDLVVRMIRKKAEIIPEE